MPASRSPAEMSSLIDSSPTNSTRVVRSRALTVAPLSLVRTMLVTATSTWDRSLDALYVSTKPIVPVPLSLLLEQLAAISAGAETGRNRFMGGLLGSSGQGCRCAGAIGVRGSGREPRMGEPAGRGPFC